MPYVTRDGDGHIIAVHANQSKQAPERLRADDPELREFIAITGESAHLESALIASDLELVRILEDVISVLIHKRIIMLTDLPQEAQRKLARRYELRSRLSDLGTIIAEQEEILLP